MNYQRVGIIGAGVIGQAIFEAVTAGNLAEIAYVLVDERFVPPARADRLRQYLTTDIGAARAAPTDLVIEAAHPDVVVQLGAELLAKGDFCAFSSSALADAAVEAAARRVAAKAGTRLLVPHGAVLALDGLSDGRNAIDRVIVLRPKAVRASAPIPARAARYSRARRERPARIFRAM